MNTRRPLGRFATAIGASAFLALAAAAPAMATTTTTTEVDDWPSVVYKSQGQDTLTMDILNNSDAHHDIRICDEESDGHPVYAYYEFDDGAERAVYDRTGAGGKCVLDERVRTAGMWRISLCEDISWRPDKCTSEERGY